MRQYIPLQISIQIPNPIQPPAFSAPVLLMGASVVVDGNGNSLYQPAVSQVPMAPADFTPEMLTEVNTQLQRLGLKLVTLEEE